MASPDTAGRAGKQRRETFDYGLLVLVLLLVVFGLVMLYSTSAYNGHVKFADGAYYLKKQIFATALGLAVMYAVSCIDYRRWEKLAGLGYLLSILLSTAVLFLETNTTVPSAGSPWGPFPFSHLNSPNWR